MQKQNQPTTNQDAEQRLLSALFDLEDLAEKKARIYSRLLTQVALAQKMQSLADRHGERKAKLESLITGEKMKKQAPMSEANEQGGKS